GKRTAVTTSAAGSSGLESLGGKPLAEHVRPVALNLDHAVDYRAAAAAAGLDALGQRFQLGGGQRQAADGGDCLAAAPLGFPTDSGNAITRRRLRFAAAAFGLGLAALGTHAAAVGGKDQPTKAAETCLTLAHALTLLQQPAQIDQPGIGTGQIVGHDQRMVGEDAKTAA